MSLKEKTWKDTEKVLISAITARSLTRLSLPCRSLDIQSNSKVLQPINVTPTPLQPFKFKTFSSRHDKFFIATKFQISPLMKNCKGTKKFFSRLINWSFFATFTFSCLSTHCQEITENEFKALLLEESKLNLIKTTFSFLLLLMTKATK